jgi:hypothetical protein
MHARPQTHAAFDVGAKAKLISVHEREVGQMFRGVQNHTGFIVT